MGNEEPACLRNTFLLGMQGCSLKTWLLLRPDHIPHSKLSSQKIFKEHLPPSPPFPVLTGDLRWSCYPPGLSHGALLHRNAVDTWQPGESWARVKNSWTLPAWCWREWRWGWADSTQINSFIPRCNPGRHPSHA